MVAVGGTVRAKAIAVGATRWLDDLPALIAELESDWSITVGQVYPDATEAFVAEATMTEATMTEATMTEATMTEMASGAGEVVLKLLIPRDGDAARHEITALRLAGGTGCAALLRHDEARGALLLERLGPSLYQLGLPIQERHEILCTVAQQVWRPASGCGLPSGADKGRWAARFIADTWPDLDRPCAARTVDHALACAERRTAAHDDQRAVLVHGDVHQWNTLRTGTGFKLVDPDGLLAEAEYDLGIIMREDPVELLHGDPYRRARWLAARTGLDPVAIWEWGVVERVSTGLTCTMIDLQPVGRQMLAAADQISADWIPGDWIGAGHSGLP